MKAQGGHEDRTTIAIVAGVVEVLKIEGSVNAAPRVEGVVGFENVLAAVVQAAISEKKSEAAEREIFLVIAGDSVRDKNEARAVEFSVPGGAVGGADADLSSLVRFGVDVGFVLAFVPSPAGENT